MKIKANDFTQRVAVCRCGNECRRHGKKRRRIKTLTGVQEYIVSSHFCIHCRKYFTPSLPFAQDHSRYGNDLKMKVLELHRQEFTLQQMQIHLQNRYGVKVPTTTMHDWISSDVEKSIIINISKKEEANEDHDHDTGSNRGTRDKEQIAVY